MVTPAQVKMADRRLSDAERDFAFSTVVRVPVGDGQIDGSQRPRAEDRTSDDGAQVGLLMPRLDC